MLLRNMIPLGTLCSSVVDETNGQERISLNSARTSSARSILPMTAIKSSSVVSSNNFGPPVNLRRFQMRNPVKENFLVGDFQQI